MSIAQKIAARFKRKTLHRTPDLPAHYPVGWFQQGMPVPQASSGASSVVSACVSRYAETIAMLPFYHERRNQDGSWDKVENSAATKLLRTPNKYQTSYDFFYKWIEDLFSEGNGYVAGLGNSYGKRDFSELAVLQPNQTVPHEMMVPNHGVEIFYSVGGRSRDLLNALSDGDLSQTALFPGDVIAHLKKRTGPDRLVGLPPIAGARAAEAANLAITSNQAAFFQNMSRPSGAIKTNTFLSREQIEQVREAFQSVSTGANSGGIPVLNTTDWQPLTMTSQDAQLVDAWRMTVEEVSRVYMVPPPLINSMENSTYDNVDNLLRLWLNNALGSTIRLVEQSLERLFAVPEGYRIRADATQISRLDRGARMAALKEGVTGGILSPNEARAEEGLGRVAGGDEPRVQQQMVPLNAPVSDQTIDESALALAIDNEDEAA